MIPLCKYIVTDMYMEYGSIQGYVEQNAFERLNWTPVHMSLKINKLVDTYKSFHTDADSEVTVTVIKCTRVKPGSWNLWYWLLFKTGLCRSKYKWWVC